MGSHVAKLVEMMPVNMRVDAISCLLGSIELRTGSGTRATLPARDSLVVPAGAITLVHILEGEVQIRARLGEGRLVGIEPSLRLANDTTVQRQVLTAGDVFLWLCHSE